jgi:hypothetical protein
MNLSYLAYRIYTYSTLRANTAHYCTPSIMFTPPPEEATYLSSSHSLVTRLVLWRAEANGGSKFLLD